MFNDSEARTLVLFQMKRKANEIKLLDQRHIFFGEAGDHDFIIHYFEKFHYSQNFHYLWSYVALLPG